MDLLREPSAVESVEDNEAIGTTADSDHLGDSAHKVENNGTSSDWHTKQLSGDVNGKIVEVKEELPNSPSIVAGKALDSPSTIAGDVNGKIVRVKEELLKSPSIVAGKASDSPSTVTGDVNGKIVKVKEELQNSPSTVAGKASDSPSPGTVVKGYGLRRWRRIKRDVTKDRVGIVDSSKLLKRGLSNPVMQLGKPVQLSADTKQMSEGSVSSTDAIERAYKAVVEGIAVVSDSRLGMGPVFAAGTNSENSEDQSSKSSTAASVPKVRHEGSMAVGNTRDKNKTKSLSGKNLGSFVPQVQHAKVQAETTKKARGERVKIEKENSYSSMESDLRSSNFPFMQGSDSVNSNGRQNGRSLSYDGNNSDDGHCIEQQVNEELRAIYGSQNGDLKDVPQRSDGISVRGEEGTSENQGSSTDQDPIGGSIQLLQSVQEALEREVQKFREIGTEDILVDDSSLDSCLPTELISASLEVHDPSSSEQLHSESELEALFRQKIEAEVEYLAISKTIHNLKAPSVGQTSLSEEQRRLAPEQSEILNKLGDAESESVKLKREADTLKQQNRVHKYISCFIIQLVLLVVIIQLFILQLSPHSARVVPT